MRLLQLFDNIGNCKFCHWIRFHSLGTTRLLDAHSKNEKFNLKRGVKVGRYLRENVVYIYFISDSVESVVLAGAGLGEKILKLAGNMSRW